MSEWIVSGVAVTEVDVVGTSRMSVRMIRGNGEKIASFLFTDTIPAENFADALCELAGRIREEAAK